MLWTLTVWVITAVTKAVDADLELARLARGSRRAQVHVFPDIVRVFLTKSQSPGSPIF